MAFSIVVCFTACVCFVDIAERYMLCFNCFLILNNVDSFGWLVGFVLFFVVVVWGFFVCVGLCVCFGVCFLFLFLINQQLFSNLSLFFEVKLCLDL